jgi:hypothetical protein
MACRWISFVLSNLPPASEMAVTSSFCQSALMGAAAFAARFPSTERSRSSRPFSSVSWSAAVGAPSACGDVDELDDARERRAVRARPVRADDTRVREVERANALKRLGHAEERVAVLRCFTQHRDQRGAQTAGVVRRAHLRRRRDRVLRRDGRVGKQPAIDGADGHRRVVPVAEVHLAHAVRVREDLLVGHLRGRALRALLRVEPAQRLLRREREAREQLEQRAALIGEVRPRLSDRLQVLGVGGLRRLLLAAKDRVHRRPRVGVGLHRSRRPQLQRERRSEPHPERFEHGAEPGERSSVLPRLGDLLVEPLLAALPRPLRDAVLADLPHRLEAADQRRERDVGGRELGGVGEDANVCRVGGHRDLVKEPLTPRVFGGVAGRLQVVVVREQEPVLAIGRIVWRMSRSHMRCVGFFFETS